MPKRTLAIDLCCVKQKIQFVGKIGVELHNICRPVHGILL